MTPEQHAEKFDTTGVRFLDSLFTIQFTNLTTEQADKGEAHMNDMGFIGHREGDTLTLQAGGLEVDGVLYPLHHIQCDMFDVLRAAKA